MESRSAGREIRLKGHIPKDRIESIIELSLHWLSKYEHANDDTEIRQTLLELFAGLKQCKQASLHHRIS